MTWRKIIRAPSYGSSAACQLPADPRAYIRFHYKALRSFSLTIVAVSVARVLRMLAAAACLALLVSACGGRRATVSTFPIPGSQVAPPQTEIAFRGESIDEI